MASWPAPAPQTLITSTPVTSAPVASTPAAARTPMRTRTIALITLGAVVVLSGAVVAAVGLGKAATTAMDQLAPIVEEQSGLEPLAEGEAASPHAEVPLDCDELCFTEDVVEYLVPGGRDFAAIGLPVLDYGWGTYDTTTPGDEWFYNSQAWDEEGGTPDQCAFTLAGAPMANSATEQPIKVERDDTVDYLGQHISENEYSSLVQVVRIFRDSDAAVEHMERASANIANCSSYRFASTSEFLGGVVTPEPALVLPDSVAAVGWAETNYFGRYYIVDVQRGNLVTRSTLFTDGEISEYDFRAFLETNARTLASLPLPVA